MNAPIAVRPEAPTLASAGRQARAGDGTRKSTEGAALEALTISAAFP